MVPSFDVFMILDLLKQLTNDKNIKNFEYEKLFDGIVCGQLNISKLFKQSMTGRDEILNQRRNS